MHILRERRNECCGFWKELLTFRELNQFLALKLKRDKEENHMHFSLTSPHNF